jgi:hypothetical protein
VVICEETQLPWVIVESMNPLEVGAEYREKITEYLGFFRKKKRNRERDKDKLPYSLALLVKLKKELSEDEYQAVKITEPAKMDRIAASARPNCPDAVRERGIMAMAQYCDEYGRL